MGADWTWTQTRDHWRTRLAHTTRALAHARRAAALTDDEDVHWFARSLEIGRRFAEVIALLAQHRAEDDLDAARHARELLIALRDEIIPRFPADFVDLLGGDPGCWPETIENLLALTPA
jgi:hypothetical protein